MSILIKIGVILSLATLDYISIVIQALSLKKTLLLAQRVHLTKYIYEQSQTCHGTKFTNCAKTDKQAYINCKI